MVAVLGGLGAAIVWAVGSIGASRAARQQGSLLTLAWVMLIGLGLVTLVLPFSRGASLSPASVLWLLVGGTGNVAGLLLMYHALRGGQMSVVMPIVTTEGGIAALIAIVAGQSVSATRAAALITTVVGVVMTAISRRPSTKQPVGRPPADDGLPVAQAHSNGDRRPAAWASLGALCFGAGLYGVGRAGAVLPAAWAVMPPRVVGVLAVTVPLALTGRLRSPHGAGRWLLLSGVCEVVGFFAYTWGARHGIAVAAVLATLAGAFSAGIGRLLFDERLRATQVVGVILIIVGVCSLSSLAS
ncbi:MAG: DMT family transporter [Solirubrobacteraceae bacterium]